MISMTPPRSRRPRCCRTCLKPMQGHPTGKNNPCRPNHLFQPSPSKPWPRSSQVIGRMMDSFQSREGGDEVDADNELDDFDTSYEYPSASSSSSDESATSTSTLVNLNKRRPAPCTPPPPPKRTSASLARSRRSVSSDIGINLVPPAPLSGDRSFFLESPFHHNPYPYPAYPSNPIPAEPPFIIPNTGQWSRTNPNHKRPTNNAQLVGLPSTSSLQRAGSARPTEFVPSPAHVPATTHRARREGEGPSAPEVQMLQPPPSHPEKFWGTECPTERAGSESRVSTPTPMFSTARLRPRPGVSATSTPRMQYLEVPPRELSRSVSVLPEEFEHASRSLYGDDDDEPGVTVAPTSVPLSSSRLPIVPPERQHPPLEKSFEAEILVASREIIRVLIREALGSLRTVKGFATAFVCGFLPLFLLVLLSVLAANWVQENWLR